MNKFILIVMMLAFMPVAHSTDMMDVSRLETGEVKKAALSKKQIAKLTRIHEALSEVEDSSLEEWLDGFSRAKNIDEEIAIRQRMVEIYTHAVAGKKVTLEYKQEVLGIIVLCSMMPCRGEGLVNVELEPDIIPKNDVKALLDELYKRERDSPLFWNAPLNKQLKEKKEEK